MPHKRRRAPPGGSGATSKIIAAVNSDKSKNSHSTHISQGRRLLRHPGLGDRGANAAPDDFDPAAFPILATQFFSLEPPRPVGQIPVEPPASLRRHRQFEHVHRLGPRAIEEMAVEIANGEDLDRALSAYDRLTTEMLKATGGDRFPALPIREVQQP